jgi:phosphatidylinositol alpha-1,6-mannosyltransferase
VFATGGLAEGGGGIAELSRQVLKTLLDLHREKRIELRVQVLDEPGPAAGDELFAGMDLPEIRWHGGQRWRFAAGLLASWPDLLLFDHVGLARLQGLLPGMLSVPYVLLIHSIEIWNNHRPDYHRTALQARLLIANSEYTARKARNHYPDLPEIVVCWPGKDQPVLDSPGNGVGFENLGPHAMLIVGRLDAAQRHKGHDQLLEALPLVLREVPDARLVIAGGGDDRSRLEAKVQTLGLADHVLFAGHVSQQQLHALYDRCALFVMPSEGDGFGMVFLEAMMHSLPCVGLQRGAAAEIFEDGVSGILVDREDVSAMAARLSGLLLDEPRRKEVGLAGFERYRERFTSAQYCDRLKPILLTQLGI